MSVLVQMRVRAPDVERFRKAYAEWEPRLGDFGGKSVGVYQAESDPNELTLLEEWESHDQMHEASAGLYATSSAHISSNTREWASTSSSLVAGDISAML